MILPFRQNDRLGAPAVSTAPLAATLTVTTPGSTSSAPSLNQVAAFPRDRLAELAGYGLAFLCSRFRCGRGGDRGVGEMQGVRARVRQPSSAIVPGGFDGRAAGMVLEHLDEAVSHPLTTM